MCVALAKRADSKWTPNDMVHAQSQARRSCWCRCCCWFFLLFAERGEKMPLCVSPPKHLLCVSGGFYFSWGMIAVWFIPSRLCRWLGNHALAIHHHHTYTTIYTTYYHNTYAAVVMYTLIMVLTGGKWDRQQRRIADTGRASPNNNHIILFDIQPTKISNIHSYAYRDTLTLILLYKLSWMTNGNGTSDTENAEKKKKETTEPPKQ